MAFITETAEWAEGIYQYEQDDVIEGGPDGIDNIQAKALAARTNYLKDLLENLQNDKQTQDPTLTAIAALATAADKFIYFTGEDQAALGTVTAFARSLLAGADAAAVRVLLSAVSQAELNAAIAGLVNSSPATLDTLKELADALGDDPNFATTMTNILSSKAGKDVKNVFTSGNYCEEKDLPATTGTVTLDLDAGVSFGGQLTGNITMANPSNMHRGQSGVIRIVNDAATPRTVAWGAYWKTPGGVMPALTATAGATDLFGYYVESATRVTVVKQEDSK